MINLGDLTTGNYSFFRAYVYLDGVKKRERKEKKHYFLLGIFETNELNDALISEVKKQVKDKLKSVHRDLVIVKFTAAKIEIRDDLIIESMSSDDIYNPTQHEVSL